MLGVTIGIGKYYRRLAERAAESVRLHAGIDTIVLDVRGIAGPFLKFDLFDHVDDENIFFFDADTRMLRGWDVATYSDLPSLVAVGDLENLLYYQEAHINTPDIPMGRYFNTGVMILNKSHHQVVLQEAKRLYEEEPFDHTHCYEQSYLNLAAFNLGVPVALLPEEYNYVGYGTLRPIPSPNRVVVAHCAGGMQYPKDRFEAALERDVVHTY